MADKLAIAALVFSLAGLWYINRTTSVLPGLLEKQRVRNLPPEFDVSKINREYVPVHKQDIVPEEADDIARLFYSDYAYIAHWLNFKLRHTWWVFENSRVTYVSNEIAERKIDIRLGDALTGQITLTYYSQKDIAGCSSIISHLHGSHSDGVRANLTLQNARSFGGDEVLELLDALSMIVTTPSPSDDRTAHRLMMLQIGQDAIRSMVKAVWKSSPDAEPNPFITFSVEGTAEWYRRVLLATLRAEHADAKSAS